MIEATKQQVLQKYPAYENDINNFIQYLRETKRDFYDENTLRGVNTDVILDSLRTLSSPDSGAFKKKSTAHKYSNAIVTLFRQLIQNNLQNTDFETQYNMETTKAKSYFRRCRNFIEGCTTLQDSRPFEALDFDDTAYLISQCNMTIEDYYHKTASNERIRFNHMVTALYIKLVLYTGILHRVGWKIPVSAFNVEKKALTVNSVSISLPDLLFNQINQYMDVRKNSGNAAPDSKLFITYYGKPFTEKTASSGVPHYTKKYLNKASFNSLAKVGIQRLLKIGVYETLIRHVTEAEDKIIDDCFAQVFGSNVDWSDYINQKLDQIKTTEDF